MILESAQKYCTIVKQLGLKTLYRSTHLKHPCTIWTGISKSNWLWLKDLATLLNEVFMFRFDKSSEHQSMHAVHELPEPKNPEDGLTRFAQAMQAGYKVPGDVGQAYRNYTIFEKY